MRFFHNHEGADREDKKEHSVKEALIQLQIREFYKNHNHVIGNGDELIQSMANSEINRSIACGFGWASNDLCVMGNNAIIRLYNEKRFNSRKNFWLNILLCYSRINLQLY